MTKVIYGERIGREARLSLGCSAVIFDQKREKILLTRRADNGQWCLPSGRVDPGESVSEACLREVWEETGLTVELKRLVGVYSSPHRISTYPDGNRWQVIAMHFEATITAGQLQLSDETTEIGYFSPAEIKGMEMLEPHRERIEDSLANQVEAYVR